MAALLLPPSPTSTGCCILGRIMASTALSYGAVTGRRRARSWSRTSGPAVTALILPISPTSTGCCILGRITASHGAELWRSNGTAAGTVLVKDIRPGSGGSSPSNLTNVNGVLYFVAYNGVTGRSYGAVTGRRRARSWSRTSCPAVAALILPPSPTSTGCCILWRITASLAVSYGAVTGRRRARCWSRTSGPAVAALLLPISPTSTGCCILGRITASHGAELWRFAPYGFRR